MNKGIIIVCLSCMITAGFLFSCKDNNVDYGLDAYYVEFVTAQSESKFLTDNGKIIVAKDSEKNYALGDRILLNYTLLSPSASGDDIKVRINSSTKIPLGKPTLASDSAIRVSAKEPVRLESVWLGSHYLNMQLYIEYKSATHKIGLLVDSARLVNDTIRMYFAHDRNNDPPGYLNRAYLSFDLENILGAPGKMHPISVQINTNDHGNRIYEFEY